MRMVTTSWTEEEFYSEPTVSGQVLADYSEGIAVLSGCTGSKLATDLVGGKGRPAKGPDIPAAMRTAGLFRDLLGDRYFLEVQAFPDLDKTCTINPAYEKIGARLGIPLVATCDVHYPFPKDNDIQLVLHAAHRGGASADQQSQSWEYDIRLTYPKSDDALYRKLRRTGLSKKAARGAILNAGALAERATVRLPKAPRLRYPLPKGISIDSVMDGLLRAGWERRGIARLKKKRIGEYRDRLEREMKLVRDKDLQDFFVATSDVISWAKNQGIAVGPARGSAAASLVCYLLRITEIDPMRYPMMLLERFLDPTRPDIPDIDLDFDDERRDEIRLYLARKYGDQNVGNIGNYVRYRGKNSIQDVARVHRIPTAAVRTINDLVVVRSDGDTRVNDSLEDTFQAFPAAAELRKKYPKLDLATRLEGNMRGMSVHAAGLVVGTRPLTELAALYTMRSGTGARARDLSVMSVDKYGADYLGCLKMDFLGLTTMGMISHAMDMAGLTLDDLYSISDHDKRVMQAFRDSDVIGVFQFEGRATRLLNRNVQPETFMELADINALSRPGPLFSGTASDYIEVRHGQRTVETLHPMLDEITKNTKGQIIYQEQILEVVRKIGGFDWTDANYIRKIISKKLGEAAFNVNFGKFAEGAKRIHGIENDTARLIWNRVVTAGTYAFNTAHSVSYAVLAWWCMWLKVHHPAEFYCASLIKADDDTVTRRLLRDAAAHGIKFLPPHFEQSSVTWRLNEDGVIQAGFKQIPGVGDSTAMAIVSTRAQAIEAASPWQDWGGLMQVKGIGQVTWHKILDFVQSADPFGVFYVADTIRKIKEAIRNGELNAPMPTRNSDEFENVTWKVTVAGVKARGSRVIYCGRVTKREMKDLIDDQRARSGESPDEIRARIKRPELTKFATLQAEDDGDEVVYLRFSRYHYRRFAEQIELVTPGKDFVIVSGVETKGFGAAVQVDKMWIIDPTEEEE